jgi:hypothetical protein
MWLHPAEKCTWCRHQGYKFRVQFRFFSVDKVHPCLSLPTHTHGNHNFLWKCLDKHVWQERPFSDVINYIIIMRCPCLEPLHLDCEALQFLTSCFVFNAVGILVKLQPYNLQWMKTTWCNITMRNFGQKMHTFWDFDTFFLHDIITIWGAKWGMWLDSRDDVSSMPLSKLLVCYVYTFKFGVRISWIFPRQTDFLLDIRIFERFFS